MRKNLAFVFAVLLFGSIAVVAQQQPPATQPPPATDTVAPAIPGVVEEGTVVEVITEGFQGTEGPITLPDGRPSPFLENTNGSNGLAFDAQGRLISVQTTPGQTRIGVLAPAASVKVLA